MKTGPLEKLSLCVVHGDLPKQLANMIGRCILNGELRPGDQLPPEAEFPGASAVSRATMLEAIKLLVSKGLVEAKPKLGIRVRPSKYWSLLDPTQLPWQFDSHDDIHELVSLFEVRRPLEPEAAALTATRGTETKLSAIGVAYGALEKSSEAQINVIESDVAFHLAVLGAAEDKYLLALGTVIEMAMKSTAQIARQRPGGLRHALALHKAVYDAIWQGGPMSQRRRCGC